MKHCQALVLLKLQVSIAKNSYITTLCSMGFLEEIGPVATRLGRLVFGEFDLFQEGEALKDFAKTPIGTHALFRVWGHLFPKMYF